MVAPWLPSSRPPNGPAWRQPPVATGPHPGRPWCMPGRAAAATWSAPRRCCSAVKDGEQGGAGDEALQGKRHAVKSCMSQANLLAGFDRHLALSRAPSPAPSCKSARTARPHLYCLPRKKLPPSSLPWLRRKASMACGTRDQAYGAEGGPNRQPGLQHVRTYKQPGCEAGRLHAPPPPASRQRTVGRSTAPAWLSRCSPSVHAPSSPLLLPALLWCLI